MAGVDVRLGNGKVTSAEEEALGLLASYLKEKGPKGAAIVARWVRMRRIRHSVTDLAI